MGNGISEALKNKNFLGEHALIPPLAARTFGACFSFASYAYLHRKTTLRPWLPEGFINRILIRALSFQLLLFRVLLEDVGVVDIVV